MRLQRSRKSERISVLLRFTTFYSVFQLLYLGLEVIEVGDDFDDRLFVCGSQLTRRWVAGLNGFACEGCLDGQERVL